MTPVARGGALLVVGIPGTSLDREARRLLGRLRPAGVILLPRNIVDGGQLAELTADLRRTAPGSLLFLDAEGGPVDRLRDIVGPAPAGRALAARPPTLSERAGRWIGHALRCFDFDVDFAPVVDLDRQQSDNALDARYLGSRPAAVIARARAFLAGLQGAGIGGCLKHFPGLGGAGEDTHFEGSVVALGARQLDADLEPFRCLGESAGAMMSSHGSYPGLERPDWEERRPEAPPDGDRRPRPATLSPLIAGDLLRRRLGFTGVLFSDDMEMHAMNPWGDLPERCADALAAGCDLLLLCQTLAAAPAVAERLAATGLAGRRQRALARLELYRERLERHRQAAPRFRLAVVERRLREVAEAVIRKA